MLVSQRSYPPSPHRGQLENILQGSIGYTCHVQASHSSVGSFSMKNVASTTIISLGLEVVGQEDLYLANGLACYLNRFSPWLTNLHIWVSWLWKHLFFIFSWSSLPVLRTRSTSFITDHDLWNVTALGEMQKTLSDPIGYSKGPKAVWPACNLVQYFLLIEFVFTILKIYSINVGKIAKNRFHLNS